MISSETADFSTHIG